MRIAMRISLEGYDVIGMRIPAMFVMNEPLVILYPRENETSPRQRSITYDITSLKSLSGICHCKQWFPGNLGKCLLDIRGNASRFRYHFELPIEEALPLEG